MFYTELKNRKLYFDGDSSFDPMVVNRLQFKYNIKYVDYLTPSIQQYNSLILDPDKKIKVKDRCNNWDIGWNLPTKYKQLDVINYVLEKHILLTDDMSEDEIVSRDVRLITELQQYQQRDKLNILRTIIYMVDMLEKNNVVYGIGRGSCVSSYVLYVIGIHDIDSYMFNLDFGDFIS